MFPLSHFVETDASPFVDDEVKSAASRAIKRAKKNVDRRASKGRKIRFVPIPKLANFMAPTQLNDENPIADELFRSLFGQQMSAVTA